jgi:hypothetical protein
LAVLGFDSLDELTGKENGTAKRWRATRKVLGFDGRPLQILPPLPDGFAQDIPEDHTKVRTIKFLAQRLGELVFSANGKAVPFDISFNEEFETNIP